MIGEKNGERISKKGGHFKKSRIAYRGVLLLLRGKEDADTERGG